MTQRHVEPRLEILPAGDRWTWRFVDSSEKLTLGGNATFGTSEEATASARRAYPDVNAVRVLLVSGSRPPDEEQPDRLRDLGRVFGALAALAALFFVVRWLGQR
ncbi:MAG: hypothetical protein ACRDKZ_08550 [Actinomycetota bacterium]